MGHLGSTDWILDFSMHYCRERLETTLQQGHDLWFELGLHRICTIDPSCRLGRDDV